MRPRFSTFPREFHKGIFEDFNREFFVILMISIFCHAVLVVILNRTFSNQEQPQEIEQIQNRYVNLIVQKQVDYQQIDSYQTDVRDLDSQQLTQGDETTDVSERPTTDNENIAERETVGDRAGAAGMADAEAPVRTVTRGRSRDQISRDARKIGLLGLITSSGGTKKAPDIDKLLGEGARANNLDETLSGVDGLRSRESAGGGKEGGHEVRGERTTEGASIEGLVEGLGDAKSTQIARTGELVPDEMSELTKETEVTKLAGRNQDEVSGVVNNHISAINHLYELELRRNPDLRGKLVVRFTINPQGKIIKVDVVSSTLNHDTLVNRIVRRMLRWDDFGAVDPAKGNAVFRHGIKFIPFS